MNIRPNGSCVRKSNHVFPSNQCGWLTCGFPLLASALIPVLQAQTLWTNAGTGDWTTASNWSSGVPNSVTDATIENGGAATLAGAAAASNLFVGSTGGNGTLSITGGSLAAGVHSYLGYNGGTGTASISGGSWSSTGQLLVGVFGNATLAISGGAVSAGESYIGYGGIGTATVSNGAWTTAGNLLIGYAPGLAATGTLTVNSGTVTADSITLAGSQDGIIAATGNINLNGGTLSTNYLTESNGSGGGHINFNGSELRALSNQAFLQGFEAGDLQILAGGAIINTNGFDIGITPVLQGTGDLTKSGNGELTISGYSAYTGGTVVNQGTLRISHYNNISSSSLLTVNTGGTFSASDFSIGNAAAGVEGLLLAGGTITMTGGSYIAFDADGTASVTSGSWTSGGELAIGDNGFAGDLTISSGSVSASILSMARSTTSRGTLNLNGGILSTGAIIESDGSRGASVNFNGGTLRATEGASLFQGFETGDVQLLVGGATFDTNGFDSTIFTAMQGVGGLTKTGSGKLTLDAVNTFTGQTQVNQGTLYLDLTALGSRSSSLHVNAGGALESEGLRIGSDTSGTEEFVINGGTAKVYGSFQVGALYDGSASMSSGSLDANAASFIGTSGSIGTVSISGGTWVNAARLEVGSDGTGTLSISGGLVSVGPAPTSTNNLDMANFTNSTGYLNLNGGILSVNAIEEKDGLGGGHINFDGGTLRAQKSRANFLINFETGDIQIGSGGATIDTQAFNIGIATAMQGVGGLTKTGTGRLTLTGTSTYQGQTLVSGGTLKVSGSISTSILTTIADGATLTGSGAVGSLTVGDGGTLSPGDSPGTLDAGITTFAGGGSYLWEINNAVGTVGAISGWDLLEAESISIGATVVNPFIIDITSLTLANAPGNASGFDPNADYTFMIASASRGISGFHADKFQLVTSDFSNLLLKSWSISSSGSAIYLTYGVVPEPFAPTLAGLSVVLLLLRRRRGTR